MNPNLPEFDMINVKLLSMVLQSCLKIYYFRNNELFCDSYNDTMTRSVEILRDSEGTHHSLMTESRIQALGFCRTIV